MAISARFLRSLEPINGEEESLHYLLEKRIVFVSNIVGEKEIQGNDK